MRQGLHINVSRFIGDFGVYLTTRGDSEDAPGDIIEVVLQSILNQVNASPHEPLILITHSMGGNILYDILTSIKPDLRIDCWVSVGGQVGQLEEMKLFSASDPSVQGPAALRGTVKPNVSHWLNVFDPVDTLAFSVKGVLDDCDSDVSYSTGAGALLSHTSYFKQPSLYRLIGAELQAAFSMSPSLATWRQPAPAAMAVAHSNEGDVEHVASL